MIYNEGIKINGLHSFVDFGLHINTRKIDLPPKNSIRKTVPFMNGFYDYTKLNGAVSWGARTISYTFDIVGETIEEMDLKRTEVVNWLCNLHDVDIYDDTIPDYHFHGSFDTPSQNEDGEKSELTVNFICYPFMIANEPNIFTLNESGSISVSNNGQPVKLKGKGNATISIAGRQTSLNTEEMTNSGFLLESGENLLNVELTELITKPYTDSSKTTNGVTFTVNEDNTITANGTPTTQAIFNVKYITLSAGEYMLRGAASGGGTNRWRMVANNETQGATRLVDEAGDGKIFKLTETSTVRILAVVDVGTTVTDLVFSPSLVKITTLEYVAEVL